MSDELDIIDILRFWETADDTPEELRPHLAVAADEIAGLRAENNQHFRDMLDASPRF